MTERSLPDMPAPSPFVLNKRHLRAHFERAAVTYEAAAVLQRQVADNMLTRLDAIKHPPARILDAGCGTGYGTRTLARRYRSASLTGVDLAQAMTAQARRATGWFGQKRFVCADAERLPFAGEAFDMVWSNLMLQWCDPAAALAEFLRVLAPSGLLMFTTFGPDTLRELKAAWRGIDNAGHVHGFLDMHDLGDALVRAGFADPVMDVEHYTLTYADVDGVLGDLKAIGAGNAQRTRSRGLTGRDRFRRFRMAYEAMAQDGRIPATYEVVYGHAWVPAVRLQRHGATATIPLSQIRRRR